VVVTLYKSHTQNSINSGVLELGDNRTCFLCATWQSGTVCGCISPHQVLVVKFLSTDHLRPIEKRDSTAETSTFVASAAFLRECNDEFWNLARSLAAVSVSDIASTVETVSCYVARHPCCWNQGDFRFCPRFWNALMDGTIWIR